MKTRSLLLLPALAALLTGCRRPHTQANPPAAPVTPAATAPAPVERLWVRGTGQVPVIMYHDVVPRKEVWFDLTTREFERQMAVLKEAGAHVVPLADVVAHLRDGKPLPPRAIALTFDDGTLGDFTNAYPVLLRYRYPATFFVHTGYVGVRSTKDHMTWDQLREAQASGLIDVQPHTVTHPEDLNQLSDEEVRQELSRSNEALEREMGHPARFFAYPSGHGDERVAQLVAQAGYEAAWNEIRAWNESPADRLHLPRFAPFRFDEIVAHWRETPPDGPAFASVDTPNAGASSGYDAGTGATGLSYQFGAWPDATGEHGRGVFTSAGTGSAGQEKPGLPIVRGGNLLLGSDGFVPMPDEEQYPAIGRPILVANAGGAVFARYQPWMGLEPAALNVLLPEAAFAVVGSDWLVHDGKLVDPKASLRVRRSTVLGVTGDGRPFVGQAGPRATVLSLGEALIQMNAREAILLR